VIIGDREVKTKRINGNNTTTSSRRNDSMRSDIERMWAVGVVMVMH